MDQNNEQSFNTEYNSGSQNPVLYLAPYSTPDLKYSNISSQQEHLIDQEVPPLPGKGAITKVNPKSPGFYSRIFLVPKNDGGQRSVINFRPLNQFVDKKSFKMDTLKSVKEIL